jgi:copper chaperone
MTIRLKVSGMSCEHCVQAVTKALENISGVTKASVSLERGTAEVETAAAAVPPEQLVSAVKEAGYEAEVIAP